MILKRVTNSIVVAALVTLCHAAMADELYTVVLNTAPLIGHPAGPYYIEVALTDGSGFGDGNNSAALSNLSFGGGGPLGGPVIFGGVSGSLEAGVALTDTSFLNLFYEPFVPGSGLSFTLDLTSNDDLSAIPDGLTLYVLDNSGTALPTLAPNGGDYFLSVALGSSGAVFNVYASDPSQSPSAGGEPLTIDMPAVTPTSSVPEPGPRYLLGTALLSLGIVKYRSKSRRTRNGTLGVG